MHLVKDVSREELTFNNQSSDQTLIDGTVGGNENAFRILVDRFMDEVSRTVTGMLGAIPEVDDVVQEVFIKLHQSLHSFRGDASLKTFIVRMAINKSLDALRRMKRRRWLQPWTTIENVELAAATRSDENLDAKEDSRILRQAIDSLPEKQRSVIILRLVEDMSTEETARALDIPYGTVLSRLKRGVERLKLELGDATVLR